MPGVAAGSPLGRLIASALDGVAGVGFGRAFAGPDRRWRRAVGGTGLQWWPADGAGVGGGEGAAGGDVCVSLHGEEALAPGRTWRIVDASGAPVLRAFHGLEVCHRAPFVASLHVIERAGPQGSWVMLAEAHLASGVSYRSLLRTLGRTAALLLRAAVRAPGRERPWRPGRAPQARAGRLVRAHLATGRAWVSARLGGDQYGIAAMPYAAERLLEGGMLSPPHWAAIPAGRGFAADPFFWPGRPGVALCEIYLHRTGRGHLAAVALAPEGGVDEEAVLLKTGGHLSYPFTWSEDARVLCLPEMAALRRQDLFEVVDGGPMRLVCTIADDVAMADPTIMRAGGLLWLCYTDADLGAYDNLCLMFAERAEGPWHRHPGNPVKIDVRSSRPGGTPVEVNGRLLRPAQDCSRTYGGSLAVNEVMECTPSHYRERVVSTLRADPAGRFPDGVHTVSVRGGEILFDGKRVSYHPRIILNKIGRRLFQ